MQEKEQQTLATELLHEVRSSQKRWFIIAMAELIVILLLCGAFIWYISLPVEESSTQQTIEDIEDGSITQIGGDNIGTGNNDKNVQKKSNSK